MTGFYGYKMGDTIVAVATAPLPSGVAVIRLSGPDSWQVGEALVKELARAEIREMVWSPLTFKGEHLDDVLAVKFKGPSSFTGEDIVEFHTHGGRAVIQAVMDSCLTFKGIRMALPGEFSRRAVLNGKMDLTAAEGLADLIAASTEAQRRQALRQLDGALGERFEGWRRGILGFLAQVEAAIDFPDEEIEVLSDAVLVDGLRELVKELQEVAGESAGERVREGIRLAIVGRPNVGKSTLLNLLAGREVAIVSPLAGTTRDVVTSTLDIGGFPVVVADTAGLRETDDVIESEGVRRARVEAERADILIAVVDGEDFDDQLPEDVADLMLPGRTLVVVSKADLCEREFGHVIEAEKEKYPLVAVNLKESAALGRVVAALEKLLENVAGDAGEAAMLTRERHRKAVLEAAGHLGNALIMMSKTGKGSVAEMVAQDLREAAAAVGNVTGRTSSEDVLDVVFSTFCIGK